jgi:hypothetical protein
MNDNLLAIALSDAKVDVDEEGGDLTNRLKIAMKATMHHWLITDEGLRFKAAVGAVMQSFGEGSTEWEQIKKELQMINQLNAMMVASKAGLIVSMPEPQEDFKPIGLLKLWEDIKKENS